ncbi:MAG: glutamate ligase domain-containing protein, partial [Candidatus Binatia bacterium]
GRHQRANAALSLAALETVSESFPVADEAVRQGFKSVEWPGRFEILREHPWIVLDGAHNGEGVNALAETLKEFKHRRKVKLLFAAMEDKDWRYMLSVLLPAVDELVLTRVQMERSAEPDQLAGYVPPGFPCRVVTDARSALKLLFSEAAPDDIVVTAGSLYLLGEIRPTAEELAAR